jgi:hypothetical protein
MTVGSIAPGATGGLVNAGMLSGGLDIGGTGAAPAALPCPRMTTQRQLPAATRLRFTT